MVFAGITASSILYHTSSKFGILDRTTTYWIDQVFIYSVALVGFYYFLKIPFLYQISAALAISLCLFYYKYGYYTGQFCWDPHLGDLYHGSIHIIASLGHHGILLGLP